MKKPKYTKEWGTSSKKEEKKNRAGVIWTSLIAFIMVTSIIGYMWIGNDEPDFVYKDKYKFSRVNSAFVYEYNSQQFSFRFFPTELEELKDQTDLSALKKPIISVTFDPETELQSTDLARFELSNDLQKINTYLIQGITKESDKYNLELLDCQNATSSNPVIKFEKDNETKIIKEGNCFLFKAKNDYDVIKLKDLLMYTLLGIY